MCQIKYNIGLHQCYTGHKVTMKVTSLNQFVKFVKNIPLQKKLFTGELLWKRKKKNYNVLHSTR